jgi:hypothetical protein
MNGISDWVVRILGVLLFFILFVAIVLYSIFYIQSLVNRQDIESPLAISAVVIGLGGFILLSAFYKENAADGMSANLKSIAKWLLITSVLLIILSFLYPLLSSTQLDTALKSTDTDSNTLLMKIFGTVAMWIAGISMVVSSITLATGLVKLVLLIKEL